MLCRLGVGPGPDPGPLEKVVALGVCLLTWRKGPEGRANRKSPSTLEPFPERGGVPGDRAARPLTCASPLGLLREEVSRLQEEVHLLRQMKEMLTKDLEESQGGKSAEVLSATELRVQLAQKEQELARAKEALQGE